MFFLDSHGNIAASSKWSVKKTLKQEHILCQQHSTQFPSSTSIAVWAVNKVPRNFNVYQWNDDECLVFQDSFYSFRGMNSRIMENSSPIQFTVCYGCKTDFNKQTQRLPCTFHVHNVMFVCFFRNPNGMRITLEFSFL